YTHVRIHANQGTQKPKESLQRRRSIGVSKSTFRTPISSVQNQTSSKNGLKNLADGRVANHLLRRMRRTANYRNHH
ncbi:hypothetical protein ACLMJR_11085, partial [Bifidobacterium longum subsp. infantis]|uniref:hypothetical protein n=2 Tax=Bifidobacterium longum TaxID=216816 RepID=UPI00398C92EB